MDGSVASRAVFAQLPKRVRFEDESRIKELFDDEDIRASRRPARLVEHRIYDEDTRKFHLTGLSADDPVQLNSDDSSILSEMDEEAIKQLANELDWSDMPPAAELPQGFWTEEL